MYKSKAILGAVAAALLLVATGTTATDVTGTVNVSATLTSACEVSASGAAISFGSIAALASTGDKEANSGSSFKVACSSSVSSVKYYSGTSRTLLKDSDSIVFDLCTAACNGSNSLDTASPGQTLAITKDGSLQNVPLYGKISASAFAGKPAGAYSQTVTVTVSYQ